jgi:chromosome segregation ATPase
LLPINSSPAEYLTKIKHLGEQLTQLQNEVQRNTEFLNKNENKNNSLRAELDRAREQNANLQQDLTFSQQAKAQETSKQKQIQQNLTEKDQIIQQLTQELINEREQRIVAQNNLVCAKQLSTKQKLTITDLNQQLQFEQETNTSLNQRIANQEQNCTNLINTYQKVLKAKETAQLTYQNTEQQLIQLTEKIKTFTKTLYQRQKTNYYQKLEQERNEMKAQIVQPPP